MKTFHLQIITQEKVVYEGDAESLILPTSGGEISVLAGHVPLVSIIHEGEMVISHGGERTHLAVIGGVLRVTQDNVVLLTDSAERFDELDEQKASEAREKAQKMMQEKLTEREMAEAKSMLQKNLLHLKLIRKKRTHKQMGA
ncbi:ATP synthase F1 subunit epsilon [Candidatus Azambacteria bacterium]|nr:ATP synthase F1 subunit epsilon [Candidatus Azambacteria bacterium]